MASSRAEVSLQAVRDAAARCRACPLWEHATQTVFGAGRAPARVMLVGEQPGDQEDRAGLPFVGPAGRVLSEGLERAGIDRRETYVTNVVKHFKWEPRGKRRLHSKPNQMEMDACFPWLEREVELVAPEVLVCLGATAARAILGKGFRVTVSRGKVVSSPLARRVVATVHPSSILRARTDDERHEAMAAFVGDLVRVRGLLEAKTSA